MKTIVLWLLWNVLNKHIVERERSTTVVVLISGAFVWSRLIYERSLHLSDTFAYRSAQCSLRYAYSTSWKQHGSKLTNHNQQTWPFVPHEERTCFLRGPLECVTEAENVNVSYNFDLRSHVIAKQGNGSEEIACRWQNNSLCQTNMSPWFYM